MKLLHWLLHLGLVGTILLILARDKEIRALETRLAELEASAEPPAASTSITYDADAAVTIHRLERQVATLETALAEARGEAETAAGQADKYKQGLEGAVGLLNARQPPPPAIERTRSRPSPRAAPKREPRVNVWQPDVSNVTGDLVIAGKIHNLGDEVAEGNVIIEISGRDDDSLIATESVAVTCDPGQLCDYYLHTTVPPRDVTIRTRWEARY